MTTDFGFPDPDPAEPDQWRIRVVARLLATDAARKLGRDGFTMSDWIIPSGNTRKRALEILGQWKRIPQLLSKLEILAKKADALLNLQPLMAESAFKLSEPLASYKGEKTLFRNEIKQINAFRSFREQATYLSRTTQAHGWHRIGKGQLFLFRQGNGGGVFRGLS